MKYLTKRFLVVLAALVVGLVLSSTTAKANVWVLAGVLDGAQETPPNISPGQGYGTLTLDDITGQVIVTSGVFSNLTVAANNAHIHGLAPPGTPAGVLIPLTFSAATSGTFSGAGILTAPQIAGMLAGQTYFNIHTPGIYSGGEIRGQILVIPEPSTLTLVGLGVVGLAVRAWNRRAKKF